MRILVSLIVLLSGLTALVAAVAVPEPTLVVRQGKGKGKGENSSSTSSSASETSILSVFFSNPIAIDLPQRRGYHCD